MAGSRLLDRRHWGAIAQLCNQLHNCAYRSPHIMEGHRARGPRIRSPQPLARFIIIRLEVKRSVYLEP